MARAPMPAWQRGILLVLLGALLGANAVYWAMTRGIGSSSGSSSGSAMGEATDTPPAITPAATAIERIAPTPPTQRASSGSVDAAPVATVATTPAAIDHGTGSNDDLLLPVQGVTAAQLHDTFRDARGEGRVHDAIDIMAAAGTPVLAVADGRVEKLFDSKAGGITLYQFDTSRTHAYYYAHLQGYAPGIHEGQDVQRGQLLGFVGATGNASPQAPHLHFAVFVLGPEKRWWEGTAINPYPLLGGR